MDLDIIWSSLAFATLGVAAAAVARTRSGRWWPSPLLALAAIAPGVAIYVNEWGFDHGRNFPDAVEVDLWIAAGTTLLGILLWGRRGWLGRLAAYLCWAAASTQIGFAWTAGLGPVGESWNDQATFATMVLGGASAGICMLFATRVLWYVRAMIIVSLPFVVDPNSSALLSWSGRALLVVGTVWLLAAPTPRTTVEGSRQPDGSA